MQPLEKWGGTDEEIISVTPISGLSVTNGQVYRKGRICAVQLRLTGTSSIASDTVIASGFPIPYTRQNVVRIGASGSTDEINASGQLIVKGALASGNHFFSAVYLIAE